MPKGLKKKKIENIKKEPGGISRTEKVKKNLKWIIHGMRFIAD